jgi:hypothetical protein
MAENMPSSDFPDFPTIYMDPSVQAGIYSCLPQDGCASAFISHQSPPYTGDPVVGRKHLCFGPCFYGDTDSRSGEVLQLPSETAIAYDDRILFLQAAWLFQQGMLFQILLKWEDAQPTGPQLPHPFQPNHPRRLPGPAWDAATPLTCMPPNMRPSIRTCGRYGDYPTALFLDYIQAPPPVMYTTQIPAFCNYVTSLGDPLNYTIP